MVTVVPGDAPRPARPSAVRALLALLVIAFEAALLAWALGGFSALALHAPALALIACWAVAGVVLALGRPTRSLETLSRAPERRWLLLALGVIPVAVAPLGAWTERIGLLVIPGGLALRWIGVSVAAAGLTIRIVAMARLGSRFSPLLSVQPGHELETRGLYAFVRHPGYLGAFLASVGAALVFGSGVGVLLALLFGALLAARVRREERLLEDHFGDAWREYAARTGAFLPRLSR